MAWREVAVWRRAGRNWGLLKTWDRCWGRCMTMLQRCRLKITSCWSALIGSWGLYLTRKKSLFISIRLQTTAYAIPLSARQECWEERAGTTKFPRANADLCAAIVDWDIKRWKTTSKLSVVVSLFGAAVWDVTLAQKSTLWQLALSGTKTEL